MPYAATPTGAAATTAAQTLDPDGFTARRVEVVNDATPTADVLAGAVQYRMNDGTGFGPWLDVYAGETVETRYPASKVEWRAHPGGGSEPAVRIMVWG